MVQAKKQNASGLSIIQSDFSTVTNANGTEITLFSGNVPAGFMGTSSILMFEVICHITTPALALPTLTVKLKFGSASFTVVNGSALGLSITDKPFIVRGKIVNLNINSQIVVVEILNNSGGIVFSALSSAVTLSDTSWSVDTSLDQTLSLTAQFAAVLSGNVTISPKLVTFEVK